MKRLQAACSLIEKCEIFADIGCDHGFVAQYVLQNDLAQKVFACDISAPSLNKARLLLGDDERVEFFVSDGFSAFSSAPSQAAILGMGGDEIIKIISGNKCADKLILQPQNHAYELRKHLFESGFIIKSDFCVFDRGRYYDIIGAEKGNGETPRIEKLFYGIFCDEKNPLLREKLEKEEKKILGYKQTEENKRKLSIIREVLKWQR